jgi:hypothetical protein
MLTLHGLHILILVMLHLQRGQHHTILAELHHMQLQLHGLLIGPLILTLVRVRVILLQQHGQRVIQLAQYIILLQVLHIQRVKVHFQMYQLHGQLLGQQVIQRLLRIRHHMQLVMQRVKVRVKVQRPHI